MQSRKCALPCSVGICCAENSKGISHLAAAASRNATSYAVPVRPVVCVDRSVKAVSFRRSSRFRVEPLPQVVNRALGVLSLPLPLAFKAQSVHL